MPQTLSPVTRIWNLVHQERSEIIHIYFLAALSSLIQLSLPLGIQAIISFVLAGTLSASLVMLITVLVIAVLLAGILQVSQMKLIEGIQQKIFVRYSYAFADRIPRLDLKQVDSFYLPELVNRFFDTISLQKSISKLLLDLPMATIQILFGLIVLSFYHPFFVVFGLVLLLVLWLILYITGDKGLQSSLTESRYKYNVAGWFEEMARLVKTFKFSLGTGLHLKKADEKTIGYVQARTQHFRVLLLQYKTLVAFKVAITAAMLIMGVVLLLNQQINIGQFIAAEIIIITVITSVEKIIINLDSVYDVMTAIEKISKLTDKPVESSGELLLRGDGPVSVETVDLSFGYEPGRPVIENKSIKIEPGQKVCIAGQDGAGKSTLLKLMTGVYNDFTGSLLINGIPIRNYNLLSLRDRTGILFPPENVFEGTLRENLVMGRPDIDMDYVHMLVKQAGLGAFLATLPFGYETILDPAGKRLPGNVIRKILLVRALAHKPALVLMEDPCPGIEEHFRQGIQQLLLQLKDTTVIIASNDEVLAKKCDQTIYLHNA